MGRRRKHGDAVRSALLDAAEQLLREVGVDGLSTRVLAERVDTSTRAVYTVFGSKSGLLAALGERAFDILGSSVAALPETDDPVADLVDATVVVFRAFALEHPALFRLAVQQVAATPEVVSGFTPAARAAMVVLERRVARLGAGPVSEAVLAVHALCEGLASVELRCCFAPELGERLWRRAMTALVDGLRRAADTRDQRGSCTALRSASGAE